MNVKISNKTRSLKLFGAGKLPPGKLKKAAVTAMSAAGFPPASELSLVFVDDRLMEEMNRKYMGRQGATDVIAFPFIEPGQSAFSGSGAGKEIMVGEIFISLETARGQSADYGNEPEEELLELLVHGILHLMQYDHDTKAHSRRMALESERLMRLVRKEVLNQ